MLNDPGLYGYNFFVAMTISECFTQVSRRLGVKNYTKDKINSEYIAKNIKKRKDWLDSGIIDAWLAANPDVDMEAVKRFFHVTIETGEFEVNFEILHQMLGIKDYNKPNYKKYEKPSTNINPSNLAPRVW